MDSKKFSDIEKIPEQKTQELVRAINSLDTKNINVTVSSSRLKPEEEFCFIFLGNITNLMEGKINGVKLTTTDIRVLFQYAKRMQYGNQISISQQTIANDLGMERSNVNRTVSKLVKAGVFYKDDNSLYMSWKFLAKGSLSDFIKADKERLNNRNKAFLQSEIDKKERELQMLQLELDKTNGGDGIPF